VQFLTSRPWQFTTCCQTDRQTNRALWAVVWGLTTIPYVTSSTVHVFWKPGVMGRGDIKPKMATYKKLPKSPKWAWMSGLESKQTTKKERGLQF